VKKLVAALLGIAALGAAAADLPPLNSPATSEHFQGKFIWADLFTADPAAAADFYAGLFAWKATTIDRTSSSGPHPTIIMSVGDRPVAGLCRRRSLQKDEVHGRWVGYVSVPDVAKALAAATARGGRILSRARDLPQRGTRGIFADREGVVLGVLNSSSGDPGEYLPEPGDWAWSELFSRDPAAAGLFYHDVIGCDRVVDDRGGRANRFVLVSGGYSRASVTTVSNGPKAHPAWLLFVRVANVDETAARAVSLGGRVLVPPERTPTGYKRAILADPTGAFIGIVELDPPVATKAQP